MPLRGRPPLAILDRLFAEVQTCTGARAKSEASEVQREARPGIRKSIAQALHF